MHPISGEPKAHTNAQGKNPFCVRFVVHEKAKHYGAQGCGWRRGGQETEEPLTKVGAEGGRAGAGVVVRVCEGQEGALEAAVSDDEDHRHDNQRHHQQAHGDHDGHQVGLGE